MKMTNKSLLMTALILGSVTLGGVTVSAEELQEFTLDEYVVTAARTETKLVDTPANISVVGAEQIESRQYKNVSEVLKDVAGANVMDNGNGAFEKVITLNGDTRVLVLVDGRRVDIASGTSSGRGSVDMNMLPDVNLIERVEVLKGAGGALYGSDAVGGVVNIITKKADVSYGKINVATGSNNKRDMSVMYSAKEDKTGLTISAASEKQDYYKYRDVLTDTTKRWPGDSEYENEKISLNICQDFDAYSNIEVGYDYSKYEGCSSGSMGNIYRLSRNEKETNNMHAKLNWTIKEQDAGYLQVYHNEYNYSSVKIDGSEIYGDVEEKTNGVDLQQAVTVSDTNKIILGASWFDSEVDNNGNYNSGIDNIAFFINDTWEFAPTWSLNAGVRYDDHSHAGDETTMSLGVNKKIDEDSHAYVNWGEVFKAPTTGDLFENTKGSGWASVGNTDLKPETGESWTVGYQTKLNNSTNLGVSYFESDLKDAINWITTEDNKGFQLSTVDNVDSQKKRGVEINLNHELNENLNLTASYTYMKVENNFNNSGYVRDWNYMPNMYRVGVNYHDGK